MALDVRERLRPGDLFQSSAASDLALCVHRPNSSEERAAIVFGLHTPILLDLAELGGPLVPVPGWLDAIPTPGAEVNLDEEPVREVKPGWLIADPALGAFVVVEDSVRGTYHAYGLRSGLTQQGTTLGTRYWRNWQPNIRTD